MKIVQQMLLGLIVVTLLPILYFGYIAYEDNLEKVTEQSYSRLEAVANIQQQRINFLVESNLLWLDSVLTRTKMRLSLRDYIATGDEAELKMVHKILSDARGTRDDIENMLIFSRDGSLLFSLDPIEDTRFITLHDVFYLGEKQKDLYMGVNSENLDQLCMSGPLMLEDELLGVCVILTNENPILDFAADYRELGETLEVLVVGVDKRTSLLVPYSILELAENNEKNKLEAISFASSLSTGTHNRVADYRGEEVIALIRDIPGKPWRLIVKQDQKEAFEGVYAFLYWFIQNAIFIMVVVTALIIYFIRKITSPITQLTAEVEKVAGSQDYSQRLNAPKQIEVNKLAEAFNGLLASLSGTLLSLEKEVATRTQAEGLAKKSLEHRSQFIVVMSHEIRTPLNALIGYSALIKKRFFDLPDLPPAMKDYLQKIEDSSHLLLTLINNVLDLAKFELGKMEISMEVIKTHTQVQSLFEINKSKGIQKNLDMQLELSPLLEKYYLTDSSKLAQVIMNVLGNAIKFTSADKKVTLSVYPHKEGIMLEVVDEGIGIPEDRIEKIFNAFEQAEIGVQRNYGGTGVGLAIVRYIAEELGGDVRVESKEGEGSSFFVYLPMQSCNNFDKNKELKQDEIMFEPSQRVLVVEDNENNQEVITQLLQFHGIKEVVCADNGREALEVVPSSKPFDLILMDYHMPECNGVVCAKELRKYWKSNDLSEVDIVLFTADVSKHTKELALEAGIKKIVTKPIDPEGCLRILLGFLRKAE